MEKSLVKQPHIRNLNIIDLILIDHRFIKECVETLINHNTEKNLKLISAKGLFEALQHHSDAEKQVVYSSLTNLENFHFNILEAQVEHANLDLKIKSLRPRVAHTKFLKEELEAELKVLAEMVKHHLKEEESELLPRMQTELDEETLRALGEEFMKARKMTLQHLENYPQLQDELVSWKDDVQKVSSQFLSKMDKYVENLIH